MESEEFFVIASKAKGGGWNKFAKAVDLPGLNAIPFFWDEDKAKDYLNNNIEADIREFYSVFRVIIELNQAEKIK